MTNVVPFKKNDNKTRIKNSIFCHFEKIYRKNNNCRVAMTTTYRSTSCNSENIVACSYHVGLAGLQITSFWNAWNFCHEIPKWPKYVILRMRIRRLYFDCFEEIGT